MILFKYDIINKNIIYICFLILSTKEYLVFPLNSFLPENFTQINNSKNFSNEDFLNYWLPNEMYTYLYIGSPPSKIYSFIESENYESYMDNSICQLPSKYENDSSSTFINISNYNVFFSHFANMCFAKETFYAYTDFNFDENTKKSFPNLTFLYAIKPYNDTFFHLVLLYYQE